jgi:hypothetical protein
MRGVNADAGCCPSIEVCRAYFRCRSFHCKSRLACRAS